MARSTFRSQNVKNTSAADHFWKLRCRKSARRCGAKHMSKSKCTKHLSVGPLLEVEMSKKCTPLWREAHFQVKMYKAHHARTTFGGSDVASRGRRKGLCTLSKVSKREGFVAFSTTTATTPHYTPIHYNYNYNYTFTTFHYTTLHYTPLHYTTLKYTQLHYTTLHSTTLHYTALHYLPLHYITLHYITLHYTTLHYTTLHYLPLHYIKLHYTTFHYTTLLQLQLHNYTPLHSTTLNYTTLYYTTVHYTTLHYTTTTSPHYTPIHYTTPQLQLHLHYIPLH